MKPFFHCKQLVYSILFVLGFLASCVPPTETVNSATSTMFVPSETPGIRPPPTLLPTRTAIPLTGPRSTTNGYYVTVGHTSIPTDVFQRYWKDNYCVTSIAYGADLWAATLDHHETCGSQSIIIASKFPEKEIEQATLNGSFVTSLAYGDGQWAVIVSNAGNISEQQINTYATFSPNDILAMQNKGYWVTNMAYGNGSWVVVFSKDKKISTQKIETSSTFPFEFLKREAKNDMFLTAQAYGDNTWVIVLSNDVVLEQDIRTQSFWSKDMVLRFWDDEKYYYQIALFYGEDAWFVVAHKELP